MRHFIREKKKTQHGFYYCQKLDSNTRWKCSSTSNKVRNAMTKKQIKRKKKFMVFIPDVKTHTGHMFGEVKFYSFKCVSPQLKWTVKSNQILFLFKDIASQYTKYLCFLFPQECWNFATNRLSPGKRNTSKCRRYPWRTRNA